MNPSASADPAARTATPATARPAPRATPPPVICLLDEAGADRYTRFVESHPDATVRHSLAWRDRLLRVPGRRAVYLMAMVGDDVVGVMPLMEVAHASGGARVLPLPGDAAAPALADDPAVRWLLESRATALAEMRAGARRPHGPVANDGL